jgi:hypothetical protein
MPRAGGVGATPSGGQPVPLGGIPSGGHPLPAPSPPGSGNRGVWIAVAAIAAVAIVLAAIVATSGGDGGGGDGGEAEGYTPEVEEEFVSSCQAAAGDTGLSESQCQCAFDEIEANVPFERFVEIDEQLREDPTDIPEELTDVMGTCLSGG